MTFSQGSTYAGFTLKTHTFVREIDSDVYIFEHDLLHCPLLAIKNNDPNKTFTLPPRQPMLLQVVPPAAPIPAPVAPPPPQKPARHGSLWPW